MTREGFLAAAGFLRVRFNEVPAEVQDDEQFLKMVNEAWNNFSGTDPNSEDLAALKKGQTEAAESPTQRPTE